MSATTMPVTFLDFMKTNYWIPSFPSFLFLLFIWGEKAGYLFNGKNLDGWENTLRMGRGKVVNGVIELVGNQKFFLSTTKKYSDFDFTGEVKLPEGRANSGFLFRSQRGKMAICLDSSGGGWLGPRWSGGFMMKEEGNGYCRLSQRIAKEQRTLAG